MARERSPTSEDDDYDVQEHQGCYIFTSGPDVPRPNKRRQTSKGKGKELSKASEEQCLFLTLLNGKEKEETAKLRWDTYHRLWADQERRTKFILDSFNQKTLNDVSGFVASAQPEKYDGKIPTALVLTGPNIASHAPLFVQFKSRIRDLDRVGPVVVLTSKDALNLKGVLKKLIKDATEQEEGMSNEDEELILGRKGAKLLSYDLQILQNWCGLHPGQKVVVAIQDTEAFDSTILADLISLFNAYLDRIPFVLLLGIATSLDIFHEKLPKATIRMMQGDKFDVERAEECLAQVFNNAVLGDKSILRLGSSVCDLLMERQRNHTQSIQTFIAALKYAYMSHFYANPLSIILGFLDDAEGLSTVLSDEHIEAIRTLPSFQRYIESKLKDRDSKKVRALVNDNLYLRSFVVTSVAKCHSYATQVGNAVEILELSRSCLSSSSTPRTPRYELLPRVLTGELHAESPMIRELLLSIKKMNSTSLLHFISTLSTTVMASKLDSIKSEVEELASETSVLTSEFDVTSSSLRSTAVSKKIQLNAHKSGLTENDALYSQLVQKVYDIFLEYFSDTLEGIEHVFLHEVFFYDLVSPHKDVFAPRARATVERALSKPVDYLDCECCGLTREEKEAGDDRTMKGSHPPTSIVYQLYLEGGALINGFDLWSAFKSVINGEDANEDETRERIDEATIQALFYRSVAEMKFLGFVKQTRKRVDHLQKLAWKGL
ncbi:origin recognition complex subunit 3 N-terminus-domain-containing protein [Trichophaea hybrida]|nr:origin recognition complex subunit 3 N-terminus-domain-containing protein [Trichophaea hybrida]